MTPRLKEIYKKEIQPALKDSLGLKNSFMTPVIEKVILNKMRLGEPDSSGRQSPKIIEGSEEVLNADLVIEALGFEPEEIPKLFNEPDLQVTKWGTIKADLKTLKTNIKGVFAAGDIVRGASLVVWAIRDGRDAAKGISQYLNQISKNKVRAA